MSDPLRKGLHWAVLLGVAIGTVLPLLIAVWLFVHIFQGNGSHAGNILRAGTGALMILISALVLGIWAASSRSSNSRGETHRGIQS
jgi:hypothetical protein